MRNEVILEPQAEMLMQQWQQEIDGDVGQGNVDLYEIHSETINENEGYIFRAATEAETQGIQDVYEKYHASIDRNAAFVVGNIDGQEIYLESISGRVNVQNPHHKGNFVGPSENYYVASNGRLTDTEQKIIEFLRSIYLNTPNISGSIEIVSRNVICEGCISVIRQFQRDFPNIKIVLIEILKKQ